MKMYNPKTLPPRNYFFSFVVCPLSGIIVSDFDASRVSTYLQIPRCHIMRGIIRLNPRTIVVQSIGLHWAKTHLSSPRAQRVTYRCIQSPMRRGIMSARTIFSCIARCMERCFRTAVNTKKLTTPMSAQT